MVGVVLAEGEVGGDGDDVVKNELLGPGRDTITCHEQKPSITM